MIACSRMNLILVKLICQKFLFVVIWVFNSISLRERDRKRKDKFFSYILYKLSLKSEFLIQVNSLARESINLFFIFLIPIIDTYKTYLSKALLNLIKINLIFSIDLQFWINWLYTLYICKLSTRTSCSSKTVLSTTQKKLSITNFLPCSSLHHIGIFVRSVMVFTVVSAHLSFRVFTENFVSSPLVLRLMGGEGTVQRMALRLQRSQIKGSRVKPGLFSRRWISLTRQFRGFGRGQGRELYGISTAHV